MVGEGRGGGEIWHGSQMNTPPTYRSVKEYCGITLRDCP